MNKITIRKINFPVLIILLLFVSNVLYVSAQKPENEFSIYCAGGFAAFSYTPMIKNASSMGYGGDIGGGFTGYISSSWGIHFDVGLGFFNVKNRVSSFAFITPDQEDCEKYHYDLHTTLNEYKETHKAFFVSVPLMLQFQTKMNQSLNWKNDKKVGYYAMAGFKAQFQFNYNYISEFASSNNAAYYPEFDSWITSSLPNWPTSLPILGLGTFDGNSASGKLKFGILVMFALETGAKLRIGKNAFLYTGVYFDCGLYDPNRKIRYINYTTPENLTELTLLKFADRINLMVVGIKLRLAFWKNSIKQQSNCSYSNLTFKKARTKQTRCPYSN